MKQAVQWASALAIAMLIAGTVTACPRPNAASSAADAVAANYNKNCATCHGAALEGRSGMAPPLVGIRNHWPTPEDMAEYLANPQGYAQADERLKHAGDSYSLKMPAIPMTEEERLALAKWVLEH